MKGRPTITLLNDLINCPDRTVAEHTIDVILKRETELREELASIKKTVFTSMMVVFVASVALIMFFSY